MLETIAAQPRGVRPFHFRRELAIGRAKDADDLAITGEIVFPCHATADNDFRRVMACGMCEAESEFIELVVGSAIADALLANFTLGSGHPSGVGAVAVFALVNTRADLLFNAATALDHLTRIGECICSHLRHLAFLPTLII